MKLKNFKGFTLVELIVVITIIIILGTIAFISFTGYSQSSRDSKRIADVGSLQKNLELYITEKGTYPIPGENENITYSGGTVWIQGTVGDGVIRNIENINKKPLDPLTSNEYTYSITASKTEYQIGAIIEGSQLGYKLPINQTHAATSKKAKAMLRGTYNEKFLRVQSGTINWILALPSIIATDIIETDVQTILTNNKLVYNNYQNIPHSYNNAGYIMTGGFNYTNPNPLIYSGSMKTLADDNNNEKRDFLTNLKKAYELTILQGEPSYKDIVNTNPSNQTGTVNLVNRFINLNVGGIKVSNIILPITPEPQVPQQTYSCTGSLETNNAYITNREGLTENTDYQKTDPEGKCFYECISGYTLDDCSALSNYTISFDGNGYTSGTMTNQTIATNTTANLISNGYIKTGYTFEGWATTATGGVEYTNGESYAIGTSNVTLYAKWVDTVAPTGGDFTMATNTNTTSVTLTITCPTDDAGSTPIQMYISGAGLASGGNVWTACINTKNITISTGYGTKNITIKWKDSLGNETSVINKNTYLLQGSSISYIATMPRLTTEILNNGYDKSFFLTTSHVYANMGVSYTATSNWTQGVSAWSGWRNGDIGRVTVDSSYVKLYRNGGLIMQDARSNFTTPTIWFTCYDGSQTSTITWKR